MPVPSNSKAVGYVAGPKVDIAVDNIASFVFSNPFQYADDAAFTSSVNGKVDENHTFDGRAIPPHRASLVSAATGASLTWERVRADSLRVARSIADLLSGYKAFHDDGKSPLIDPRSTVLICLPNCLPFVPLLLGAWASACSVTPVSPFLMPNELARILAKARPQLLFIAAGEEGEGRMQQAIDVILTASSKEEHKHGLFADLPQKVMQAAVEWAHEVKQSWQTTLAAKYAQGERLPKNAQRVWTVNVGASFAGGADYYGSSARRDGVSALSNAQDWSRLLAAPQGHRHAEELDQLAREAFVVKKMSLSEQTRRVALLLWSSGTTGASKGVMISHRALVAATLTMWHTDPTLYGPHRQGGEVWVALAPWTHVFGLSVILLPALAAGATMVIPPSPRFNLASYLDIVQRYGVTQMHVVPPVVVQLSNFIRQAKQAGQLDKSKMQSVRRISSGGAPTTYVAVRNVFELLSKPVHQAYGTTETVSTALATAYSYDSANKRALEEIGSVGMPHCNVEIAIHPLPHCSTKEAITRRRKEIIEQIENTSSSYVRPHALHKSTPGEIWVRGAQNMIGYYSGLTEDPIDREASGAACTADGWYRTGDEGMLDAYGQLWIVGRIKELIKVKGFQVAPVELDSVFVRHPDVADAAVVGVREADDESEEICLYVQPTQSVAQSLSGQDARKEEFVQRLTTYATEQVAHYKWPKYIVICPQITKSPTGKILRKDLHLIKEKRYLAPRPSDRSKARATKL